MPSVVAEFLESAGSLDKADLSERLEQLELKVSESRASICETVKGKWLEFLPEALVTAEDLIDQTNQLSTEIEAETNRVKAELRSRSRANPEEVAKVNERLKEIDSDLIAVTTIVELGDLFDKFNSTFTNESPMGATNMIRQMQEKITEIDANRKFVNDQLLTAMKEEFCERKERLLYELLAIWSGAFVWKLHGEESAILTISTCPLVSDRSCFSSDFETFKETLSALHMLGELTKKLKLFASALLQHFCFPLIRTKVVKFEAKLEEQQKSAKLLIEKEQPKDQRKGLPSSKEVLVGLEDLFNTLNDALNFDVLILHDSGSSSQKFLSLLGEHLAGPLMESLVKDCLKAAIPDQDTEANMHEFNDTVALAEKLVENLKLYGIVGKSEMPLRQYAENLDCLFADKKCSHTLMRARQLIQMELHNSVLLEPLGKAEGIKTLQEALSNTPVSTESTKELSMELKFDADDRLPPVFHFPKCRVSSTILDLFKLVVETLVDATISSPQKAGRLVLTARNVLEIYTDVVLIYHARTIETLPNVAALFYNNTMYLAHQLLTLGVEFSPKLTPVLGSDKGCPVSFIDFIPRLRQLAIECLDSVLEKQKEQMDECLKGANDFRLCGDKDRYQVCEKALKQVVMQLQHLNRIWTEVLPPSVMFRAQGVLVQHLFDYLLRCLFKMEDISADDATTYAGLFADLLKKAELLFVIEKLSEIAAFCDRDYMRFKEVLLMLKGSLLDINDRWAAGKGPLATYCSPLEVKGLIRALFQNTEKRATILAQIK